MPGRRIRILFTLLLGLTAVATGICLSTEGRLPGRTPQDHSHPVRLVVGLGDSVTSGAANDGPDYVTLYATTTAPAAARAVNLGRPGLTARGLDAMLASDPDVRAEVSRADTVLVTIGANDLHVLLDSWSRRGCDAACQQPAIRAMGAHLAAVLDRIKALRPTGSRVGVTTYWNVFGDGAVARATLGTGYLAWSDEVTRAADAEICREASLERVTCIDLYTPFKGAGGVQDPTPYLAPDGDHPNRRGVALIVAAVRTALPAGQPA